MTATVSPAAVSGGRAPASGSATPVGRALHALALGVAVGGLGGVLTAIGGVAVLLPTLLG
ncbi:hypothetical protein KUM42_09875 [Modestobacter sp. L9-4]|uniref:hypothetical protein n=1 Tax=Modestobacter sp. L9-4 TaxID=2851567 RepID=UPI001C74D69A|nr:hypothetical protein [Modestobacter sp. L9-4]QXG77769.1 hypothetical protein KUM42_09875 [Modestobacter sp. L9-4]